MHIHDIARDDLGQLHFDVEVYVISSFTVHKSKNAWFESIPVKFLNRIYWRLARIIGLVL